MNYDDIAKKLVEMGVVDRAVVSEKKPQCVEIASTVKDTPIFLYVFSGRFTKIKFAKITVRPIGCLDAIVDPNSLYTILNYKNDNIYYKQLKEKIKALIKIKAGLNPKE